jgi:vitamin K-dependent gamma-carboxylase
MRIFERVDPGILCMFRVVWALVILYEVWAFSVNDYYQVRRKYFSSSILFPYYGFEFVKLCSFDQFVMILRVMQCSAFMVIFGCMYHVAMTSITLCFAYIFLLDETRFLNHFYLIVLVSAIMSFAPANSRVSVDSWMMPNLFYRKHIYRYWYSLLQCQLLIVYVYAGNVKVNDDWLRGEPMRHWLLDQKDEKYDFVWRIGKWWIAPYLFSYGGILFDMMIIPLLMGSKGILFNISSIVYVMFHIMNKLVMGIGVFPYMCIGFLLLFVSKKSFSKMLGYDIIRYKKVAQCNTLKKQFMLLLLVIYMIVQLVVPLRWALYTTVDQHGWSDVASRFSWRMKAYDKECFNATVTIHLENDTKVIDPITMKHLNGYQHWMMIQSPFFSRRYAMWLADAIELLPRSKGRPKITMNTACSYNFRKPQPLFLPNTDLADPHLDTYNISSWITHLPPLDDELLEQYPSYWNFKEIYHNQTIMQQKHKKWCKMPHV